MHSVLYFTFIIIYFDQTKCSYVIHNNKLDQMYKNIEMFVNPIKKISGIFPNHEFEVQFDVEHMDTRPNRRIIYKNPSNSIVRSKNISSVSTTTSAEESAPVSPQTTSGTSMLIKDVHKKLFKENASNPIVHMKDLKKALEEYDKKHAKEDCTKKELTPETPNFLSSLNNNPALSDVLQLIKRGAKLQNEKPKPGDSDLSWIKIKVPTA